MLCHSSSKHIGIVILVNYKVAVLVLVEKARSKFVKFEAASTLPIYGLRYATLLSFDYFLHSDSTMGVGMIAQLHTNPSASHFVSNSRSGSTTKETVEDYVFFGCIQENYSFNQFFWFF